MTKAEKLKKARYKKQTLKRANCPKRKAYLRKWRKKNRKRINEYQKEWDAKNPDKVAQYKAKQEKKRKTEVRARAKAKKEHYKKNKVQIEAEKAAKKKAKYEANKDRLNAARRAFNQTPEGKEKLRVKHEKDKASPKRAAYVKKYQKKNAQRRREYLKTYIKERMASDPAFKLQRVLRKRTKGVLARLFISKTFQKHERFLGCTLLELKEHIEKQFEPWMTWQNHGKYGWHVDHIKPLSKFDLSDPKQFAEASHYTNLRPLHWRENLSKHAKEIV